jgi:hypothetical protein
MCPTFDVMLEHSCCFHILKPHHLPLNQLQGFQITTFESPSYLIAKKHNEKILKCFVNIIIWVGE